jgi:MGT family glycosyltransferase
MSSRGGGRLPRLRSMARFLFATVSFTGHVNPGLPIAAELVKRGHEVFWCTGTRFKNAIERTGATFVPVDKAFDLHDTNMNDFFPEREQLKGLPQLRYDLRRIFIETVPDTLQDLEAIHLRTPIDVVVGDTACGAAGLLAERHGLRWAVFGITVLPVSSVDTAPFGLGLMPNASLLGRVRNRVLNTLTVEVIFKEVNQRYGEVRQELGFAKPRRSFFDSVLEADLFLQSCVPAFEYPRSDLSPIVNFIGSFIPEPPKEWTPPSWWADLNSGKKVVLVTQGTIANDYDDLIRPTIRALAGEDVLVIATTGSSPASEIGINPLPASVRAEQFVPYAHLMPKVDLMITNGGYGSVQIALSHGVPIVGFGHSEDKGEIVNRIQWSGVGIGKRVKRPTEGQIRAAVHAAVGENKYRERAKALQRQLAEHDAPRQSGDLLEGLLKSPSSVEEVRATLR